MGNPSQNRSLALAFLGHAFAMEVDKALALLASDVSWWVQGDPGRLGVSGVRDHKRIARMLQALRNDFPTGMHYRILGTTAEGDRVAVEVEAGANGLPYHNTYHFLFVIDSGKIRTIREYMDTLAVSAFLEKRS